MGTWTLQNLQSNTIQGLLNAIKQCIQKRINTIKGVLVIDLSKMEVKKVRRLCYDPTCAPNIIKFKRQCVYVLKFRHCNLPLNLTFID